VDKSDYISRALVVSVRVLIEWSEEDGDIIWEDAFRYEQSRLFLPRLSADLGCFWAPRLYRKDGTQHTGNLEVQVTKRRGHVVYVQSQWANARRTDRVPFKLGSFLAYLEDSPR